MKKDLFEILEKEVDEIRKRDISLGNFDYKFIPGYELYRFNLEVGDITVIYDVFHNRSSFEVLANNVYEKMDYETFKEKIQLLKVYFFREGFEGWDGKYNIYGNHEMRVQKATMLDWYCFSQNYDFDEMPLIDFLVFLLEEPRSLLIEMSLLKSEGSGFVTDFFERKNYSHGVFFLSVDYSSIIKKKNAKKIEEILGIKEKALWEIEKNYSAIQEMSRSLYDLIFQSTMTDGLMFAKLFELVNDDEEDIAYSQYTNNNFLKTIQYYQHLNGLDDKSFKKMFKILFFSTIFNRNPGNAFIDPFEVNLKSLKTLTERIWIEIGKMKEVMKKIAEYAKNKGWEEILDALEAIFTIEETLAVNCSDWEAAFILLYSEIFFQSNFSFLYRQIMKITNEQKVSIEDAFDICYSKIIEKTSNQPSSDEKDGSRIGLLLGDYIEMYQELEGRECIAAFPAIPKNLLEIKRYHDDLSYIYGVEKDKEISKLDLTPNYERNKQYEYTGNEFSIVVPKTGVEIISEAVGLRHCVRAYVEAAQKGKTNLLFLRKTNNLKKPLVTIELSNNKRVVQAHGIGNRLLKDNEQSFLKEWSEQFGIAI